MTAMLLKTICLLFCLYRGLFVCWCIVMRAVCTLRKTLSPWDVGSGFSSNASSGGTSQSDAHKVSFDIVTVVQYVS